MNPSIQKARQFATVVAFLVLTFTCITVFAADSPATAPGTSLFAATPVTLHLKNVTARQALDELRKITRLDLQCDSRANDARLDDGQVSIDLDSQPLWSALVPICDAASLRPIRLTPDKPGLIFGAPDGAWSAKYTDVRGGFAIGVLRVEQNGQIDYAERYGGLPPNFVLTLCICPEPGLNVQRIAALHLTKCLDESGFPVSDPDRTLSPAPILPATPTFHIRTVSVTKLSLVEGEFTAVIEKDRKHIEIANVLRAQNVVQSLNEAKIEIRSFAKNGRQYLLQVIVRRGDMDDDQLKKIALTVQNSRPTFLNVAGKSSRLLFANTATRAVPAGTMVTFTYIPLPNAEEPATMAWDLPTDTSEVTVPFSFKDVPLPGPSRTPDKSVAVMTPATLPAIAKIDIDVAREVRSLLPQLSALTAERRQDAEIRLGLLSPTAFATIESIANDTDVPPAARQQLSIYLKQRGPLQAARLRRAKKVEDDQQLEEANALDAYGRFGKRNPKWDGLVRQAFHIYFHTADAAPKVEARQALEKAIEAGCDDPLVQSLTAYTIESTGGNPRQTLDVYAQADADFRFSQYPDYFKVWHAIDYCGLLYRTTSIETNARGDRFIPNADAKILNRLRSETLFRFASAVKLHAPPSQLLAMAMRILNQHKSAEIETEPVYRRLAPSLEAALPNRTEPLVLKGRFYVEWAWEARGDGFAGTVTDKGAKLMKERLLVAEDALKRAYEMDPTDPAAPTEMLTVELGQGKGKEVMEQWFKRAMEADPDNQTACSHKMYYLEPKWYGSEEQVLAFGEECYKTGNYAAKIPMMLVIAHKTVSDYAPDQATYYQQPQVWQDVKRVYEPYLRVCPNDAQARNEYCTYAGTTGHWSVAREQLELLGDKVAPSYYGNGTIEDLKEFRKKAQAASKPSGGL